MSTKPGAGHFAEDRNHIWAFRQVARFNRAAGARRSISIRQLQFLVQQFGAVWPPVPHPRSSWGENHPWNASEFIRSCISSIGLDSSDEASRILDDMAEDAGLTEYQEQIRHVRAQQRKLRRDTDFRPLTVGQLKELLRSGLPADVDDLKALMMDKIDEIQVYLRHGDTMAWEAYWEGDVPKDENTCRNRLLDALRPRFPSEINFLPETIMPEGNRADIVALYHGIGVPIEIKGQWHPQVWDATRVQLIEKYAHDWRAQGRGIFLVLWCGPNSKKPLTKPPAGFNAPSTPDEMHQILQALLSEAERARIDIVTLDVSKDQKFS